MQHKLEFRFDYKKDRYLQFLKIFFFSNLAVLFFLLIYIIIEFLKF